MQKSDAQEFQHTSIATRNRIVGLQNAAAINEAAARSKGTDSEYDRSWSRWKQFLRSIEIGGDLFLDRVSAELRPGIFVLFAQAVREREFSRKGEKELATATVRKALDQVAKIFRARGRPHPFKAGSQLDFELDLLFQGHTDNDPPEEQEVAITPSFLREISRRSRTDKERKMALLFIMAFFFAMRSCEYLITTGPRRTTNACMKDVMFVTRTGGHIDQKTGDIFAAAAVRIKFRRQKNKDDGDIVTQEKTADPLLNPVRVIAFLVTELWTHPATTWDTPLCTYITDSGVRTISTNDALSYLRRIAEAIGEDKLGFHWSKLGTHSIRSAAAMAMFLDNTPIFLIMLIGRWRSDGFLKYIRKQVLESCKGTSSRMLKNDLFHTLPSPSSTIDDPRIRTNNSFATNLSSMALTSSRLRATRPFFALHH